MKPDELIDWAHAIVDAFHVLFGPVESVDNEPTVSEKRAEAGRKGGLAKQAKKQAKLANGSVASSNASPHPTPSLDGGGDGGGASSFATTYEQEASQLASHDKLASQASQQGLDRTDKAVRERERLVKALPAQYAHVDNPERFYQLAEQAFGGDGDRYERAVIEFVRLRDLEDLPP